ncbi:MAG: magnesium transporter [Erysipelotrichales bacterium]|nr:magnesium transporter [Erysipelotrichales bacterium]
MINTETMVKNLKDLLAEKKFEEIREVFRESRVVDMADPIGEMDVKDILIIFSLVDKETSAQLFTYMDDDKREELIEKFTGNQLRELLEEVYTDDIVDIMGDLPANLTKKILQSATPETRKEINLLLSFPEDSAGSIMSCDFFELIQYDTVGEVILKLKQQGNTAETINTCYVIDDERRLVGSVQLKNLLFEKKNVRIKDIMERDPVSVLTSDDQEKVAEVIRKYDIAIVPVVNDEKRLIGIITIDDVMDVMEEEITEDIHKMNAVAPIYDSYADASVMTIVKSRLPWLLVLMITNMFSEMIIAHYEAAVMAIPILVGFMPVIMDIAGNGGGQSSTVIIRSIATGDVKTKDIWKVLRKEFTVGVICSAVLFAITFTRLYFFASEEATIVGALSVALSVSGAMCIALILGKTVGGLLPILVNALHFDPASVAAPIITTLSDTTSLFIYFEIASLFFKLN